MAGMDDVRRGLAANLRALPDCTILPYPKVNITTPTLSITGVDELDYALDMGPGADIRFVLEGFTGSQSLQAAIQRFDQWLWPEGDTSVRQAIEADQKLTKRLKADGKTVLSNQESAADIVELVEFQGYRREALESGGEALVGEWLVRVVI